MSFVYQLALLAQSYLSEVFHLSDLCDLPELPVLRVEKINNPLQAGQQAGLTVAGVSNRCSARSAEAAH